jgi:murein DD-endopeptidase MepM/ murein hydrolase activator NlpD
MTLPALALPLVSALIAPLSWAASGALPAWQPPVVPLVVERPFLAPQGPYSPGHRGVDLGAEPGSTVRAPARGVVRVAGRVAGKAVVSIEHPHRILGRTGWRTTYEGVLAEVDIGDAVAPGDAIGVVVFHDHARGIHWGLKNGRVYADPLLLLRRPIVLKPLGRPLTGPPQWSGLRAGIRRA